MSWAKSWAVKLKEAPAEQNPPAGKTEFLMVAVLSGNCLSSLISHMFPDIPNLCLSHTQVHTQQRHMPTLSYVL